MTTPVSILTELMVQIHSTLEFKLLNNLAEYKHLSIYLCRVTAKDVIAHGKGSSKKEAKHEAARAALEKLAEQGIYHAKNKVAPRKQLQNAPAKPDAELNVIEAIKKLRIRTTIETARKELAKQMLQDLNNAPEIIRKIENSVQLVQIQIEMIPEEDILKMLKTLSHFHNIYEHVKNKHAATYPHVLKEWMKAKKITNQELWKDIRKTSWTGLVEVLNRLKLDCTFETSRLENITMATIILNTNPEFKICGLDESRAVAIAQALEETISFLEVMTM